ncbi:MAG: aromatic hydrocarbon degradation protein, partial [Gammaproteobacteria bacterium]
MRKEFLLFFAFGTISFATNGDFLIGVGAVSRGMGGVGIATVTNADSTIFSNPALMTEYKKAVFSFGGTLFMPHTKGYANGTSATSDAKYFAVPSIGFIYPMSQKWFFGISAYGISGMGVDYRNTNVKCNPTSPGCYTNFQTMEVAPSLAYKVNEKLSVGFGLDLSYGALDLGAGLSSDYAVGVQVGVSYKVNPTFTLGAVIKSPLKFNFARVGDFNGDGILDDMTL